MCLYLIRCYCNNEIFLFSHIIFSFLWHVVEILTKFYKLFYEISSMNAVILSIHLFSFLFLIRVIVDLMLEFRI